MALAQPSTVVAEARVFWNLAWPSVVIQVCTFGIWFENAMFVGTKLGTTELAAVSMANLTGNLTGLSIIFGLLSALDTLAPQAVGMGRVKDLGVLALRGYLVSMSAIVPAICIWWQMEQLLVMIGQPAEVSRLAGRFLKIYVLAVPPLIFTETARRFLQCQQIVRPFVVIMAVMAGVVHPIFLHLYHAMGLGFDGVALAVSSTFWVYTAATVWHIKCNRPPAEGRWRDTWFLLFEGVHSEESLSTIDVTEALRWPKVKQFLYLGVPGILSMSEWWYWEVLAFMAGQFGTAALAAHSVAYNIIPLAFMVPLGIRIGLSNRVGTLLGAGEVSMAQSVTFYATVGGSVIVAAYSFVTYLLRYHLIHLFTDDPAVVEQSAAIWFSMCLFLVVDGIYGVQSGTLLGLGLQFRMGMSILIALWIMSIPIMHHFAFVEEQGLAGLWRVMPWSYVLFNVLLFLSYYCISWADLARAIRQREGIAEPASPAAPGLEGRAGGMELGKAARM